jgi:hypothetical protein
LSDDLGPRDNKATALPRPARYFDLSLKKFDYLPRYSQAETCPTIGTRKTVVNLSKFVKDVTKGILGNSDPGIGDFKTPAFVIGRPGGDTY